MTTIRSCVVGGLLVAIGVAGLAVAKANCTKGCRTFHTAVGETVINGIQGNYCLVFPFDDRGGDVLNFEPSDLVNEIFIRREEWCDAYDDFHCFSICMLNVPYKAAEPNDGNKLGGRMVWRYLCVTDETE